MTKRKLAILSTALGATLAVSSVARSQGNGADAFDGAWRYRVSCGACHGATGEGIYAFGPPLKGDSFIVNSPPVVIIGLIQQGRYNRDKAYPAYPGMPAFASLRAGEAQALVAYLKGGLQQ